MTLNEHFDHVRVVPKSREVQGDHTVVALQRWIGTSPQHFPHDRHALLLGEWSARLHHGYGAGGVRGVRLDLSGVDGGVDRPRPSPESQPAGAAAYFAEQVVSRSAPFLTSTRDDVCTPEPGSNVELAPIDACSESEGFLYTLHTLFLDGMQQLLVQERGRHCCEM